MRQNMFVGITDTVEHRGTRASYVSRQFWDCASMSTRKLIMWRLSPSLFTLHFTSLKAFIAHMVSINLVYKGGGIGAMAAPLFS